MRRLVWVLLLAGCADDFGVTPDASTPDASVPASSCDVPALFAARCLTACHDQGTRLGGLDLQSQDLGRRLFDRRAAGRSDYLIIDSELPEESALYLKLLSRPPYGTRMPQTGEGLTAAERACVLAFVTAAADAGLAQGDAGTDGGPSDAGNKDGGPVPMFDAGFIDAGRFWGPSVDVSGCVPDAGRWCIATRVAEPLYAVRGLSNTDIWAVGSRGAVYHYDGAAWARSDAGVSKTLFDVHPVSAGEVWAVGEQGLVLRYSPGGWQQVPWSVPLTPIDAGLLPSGQPPGDLGGVWATANEVWMAGPSSTLARYAAGSLRVVQAARPGIGADLAKIYRRDANEWWAAGDHAVLSYDGGTWTEGRGAIFSGFGIWGSTLPATSAPVTVVVGASGNCYDYDYNTLSGYPWQPIYSPAEFELKKDLRSVWLDGASQGWAVGLDGQIMQLNLATKKHQRHVTPVGDHLLGVWGTSVGSSWAVGGRTDGIILRSR